jgi:hypothetical protein
MFIKRTILCLLFIFLFTKVLLPQEEVRIYLANAETYHKVFLETLDYYIDLVETAYEPFELQSRWNCDGSYWMWEYEKNF